MAIQNGNTPSKQKPFNAAVHFNTDLAEKYDENIRLFCTSYDVLHEMVLNWLRNQPERSKFLSSGAGTGTEILCLGKHFPLWQFTAVDVSASMITTCQKRVTQAGMDNRVKFSIGRVEDFHSTFQFDSASSIFVSHFIKEREDKLKYFGSIAANLKSGAPFILADLFGAKDSDEFQCLSAAWLVSCESQGWSAEVLIKNENHIERDISFIPETELFAILIEAGFEVPVRFYQTYLFGAWITWKRSQ
ncbi:tRNA (cmo5U34)-methyltransferase [Dehalogenimonas formicexedens]|uniref:tRNA (Cmo5U34)-methyltransferase n=2 Tax=Dehalogenimonas TaxID=670486 RepID=A0A1P8FA42_9CHLR|nr:MULTISPECIES: class I SAM-dependent methyltransferase [Dehalogenimonas]APV45320.1 tRNA (cmo5U34)-methyltransferase [Dehalogenimonas formicexedens]KTB49125.1 Methylase involved in ubiquinone/menaquinone biosynthesis [Dehalogenimonas alkenigignens]